MGKSSGTIRERILMCASCQKPIGNSEHYTILGRGLKKYLYHSTAQLCASAEPLQKDWYRQNDRTNTKTYNRTQARLQDSDGHTWDTDDSLPVWLGDMESEDNI